MGFNILAAGMVTSVGFTAEATCAAIRAHLDNHQETRFMFDGEWIIGGMVPFPSGVRGREKLLQMVVPAVEECFTAAVPAKERDTVVALCLAEADRPGRFLDLDGSFADDVLMRLSTPERVAALELFHQGRIGGVDGLKWAEGHLADRQIKFGIVAGVDTLLTAQTLEAYHAQRRLLTVDNTDGFIPGEAACTVLISPLANANDPFQCLGIGLGQEDATLQSTEPLRANGLVQAYRAAFSASGCSYEDVDYRLTDITGEQYAFKDAALALLRTMRVRKAFFDLWHPTDCVGEVGAASVPLVLGVALNAARKGYAPGPGILCHFSNDQGRRAAAILREYGKKSHPPMD